MTLNEARDTICEWSEMVIDAADNWGLITEQKHTELVELVHQRGKRGPGLVPVFQLGEQCVPDFPLNYDARLSSTAFTRYQNFLTWLAEHEPIDALIDKAKADAEVSMGRDVESISLAATPATLGILEIVASDVFSAARIVSHEFVPRESLEAHAFEIESVVFGPKPQKAPKR